MFPSESNNPSFADVYFRHVSSTPTLYTFDIKLQQNAFTNGIYDTKNYEAIRNNRCLECLITFR